jgi:SAM-dependent methyltransferase
MDSLNISFQCPVHHSPGALAHAFNYEPYITLKIDGIFKEIKLEEYNNFYPVFPNEWTKIEGEIYYEDSKPAIFYLFYVKSSVKEYDSLDEMYQDMVKYYNDQIEKSEQSEKSEETINSSDLSVLSSNVSSLSDISESLKNDIVKSLNLRDTNLQEKIIWYPKKYFKLDTTNWNIYIDQLNALFSYVNDNEIKSLIKHDGLVITPNKPTNKTSLIKLKPPEDLTIDLFFNGKSFMSRNRTVYNHIVQYNRSSTYNYGDVYRLAPNRFGKYVPVYQREVGKRANPNNIIEDILYKYYNYYNLSDLKNLYHQPWYSKIISDGLTETIPLFEYTQFVYNQVLSQMNYGKILDIGCGSMGQYVKHFLNNSNVIKYIGLDIDLSKLHEAQVKVKYDNKFKFVLFDIRKMWKKQDETFKSIWNSYFKNMMNLNEKYDNIISIFSSQYANENPTMFNIYINEINYRSVKGTKIFIMWVDHTLINETSDYYQYDKSSNKMTIRLPHRETHNEPGLGNEMVIKLQKHGWSIDNSIQIENPYIDKTHKIYQYMDLINWFVMVKLY